MTVHVTDLMTRTDAGITVTLSYLPTMQIVAVRAKRDDEMYSATVEPEHALDAFHHPAVYLSAEAARRIWS